MRCRSALASRQFTNVLPHVVRLRILRERNADRQFGINAGSRRYLATRTPPCRLGAFRRSDVYDGKS